GRVGVLVRGGAGLGGRKAGALGRVVARRGPGAGWGVPGGRGGGNRGMAGGPAGRGPGAGGGGGWGGRGTGGGGGGGGGGRGAGGWGGVWGGGWRNASGGTGPGRCPACRRGRGPLAAGAVGRGAGARRAPLMPVPGPRLERPSRPNALPARYAL